MFRAAMIALALAFSANATADTLKNEAELRALTDRVMGALTSSGVSAAFERMKPYALVTGSEFESLSLASKSQRDQFGARYGKTIGFEFIAQKKVGDSLVRIIYIERTEKHALPWIFYFYKTPSGWALNSFSWNDRMPQIFDQN